MMQENRIVSVVIPVYNEEQYIAHCLKSLTRQKVDGISIEVIVVDNGSTDNTMAIVNSFNDRLSLTSLSYNNATIAAVRNRGVREANGAVVAFLDADCTVTPEWLATALPYFDLDCTVAAVGCSYVVPEDYGWVAKVWDYVVSKNRRNGEVKQIPAGNMIVERGKFENVDGFNENLVTNEDFDLCYRLQDKGYKILADNKIKAFHWGTPDTILDFYRQSRWHGHHVYKVFFSNINKMRNLKAVLFGIYFFVIQLLWPVVLLWAWMSGSLAPVFLLLVLTFLPPFLLACKSLGTNIGWQIVKLSILYLVYGIARSHSIIDVMI